jgi:hypothetical protein
MTGGASGEAMAGSVGTASAGVGVAAASGVDVEPVHATDAMSAMKTPRRMPQISPPANGQVTGQPTALKCKQAVEAVQSASVGLTGLEASP